MIAAHVLVSRFVQFPCTTDVRRFEHTAHIPLDEQVIKPNETLEVMCNRGRQMVSQHQQQTNRQVVRACSLVTGKEACHFSLAQFTVFTITTKALHCANPALKIQSNYIFIWTRGGERRNTTTCTQERTQKRNALYTLQIYITQYCLESWQ